MDKNDLFERIIDLLDEYMESTEECDSDKVEDEDKTVSEEPDEDKMVVIKQEMPLEEAPEDIKKLIDFIRGGR